MFLMPELSSDLSKAYVGLIGKGTPDVVQL
jgi:hypothetical protein